jgi:hypothetical protein
MSNQKFRNLKFKIHTLKKDDLVLDKFPELKKYKALNRSRYPNLDKVLRYIIYLYDPNSDLVTDVPDLPSRKRHAATLAGFEQEDKELTTIFQFREPKVVDLIHCFLTEIYHNRDYREWCTLQQELDEATRLRLKGLDDDTEDNEEDVDLFKASDLKGKLRKQCDDIHEKLDRLEKKLFGGDIDLQETAYKSRFINPESWTSTVAE